MLYKSLKNKEVIYYVNFAVRSPLDFVINQRFKENGKVKAIKGETSLSNTVNRKILPKERKLGTKNIHLVVDEYGSQDLSTEEAKSLHQILTKEEKFIYSTVLIAAQPIEIKRVDNFYEGGIKRKFSQKKLELDKLIEIMGMKKKILRNVMRTTVEINTLAEITQAYLNNQSNQYVRQQQNDINSNLPKIEESRFQSTFTKLPQSSSSKLSSSTSITSVDSSKSARNTVAVQSQEVTYHGVDKTNSKKSNFNPSCHNASSKQSSFFPQNTSLKSSSLASVTSND